MSDLTDQQIKIRWFYNYTKDGERHSTSDNTAYTLRLRLALQDVDFVGTSYMLETLSVMPKFAMKIK